MVHGWPKVVIYKTFTKPYSFPKHTILYYTKGVCLAGRFKNYAIENGDKNEKNIGDWRWNCDQWFDLHELGDCGLYAGSVFWRGGIWPSFKRKRQLRSGAAWYHAARERRVWTFERIKSAQNPCDLSYGKRRSAEQSQRFKKRRRRLYCKAFWNAGASCTDG